MKCKIVRSQKHMWRNVMRSIKKKIKVLILYYSIDIEIKLQTPDEKS